MTSRLLISAALVIGFTSIAVFGAFAMGHTIEGQNACIAATASGADCLAPSNLASIASLYLGAFSTFSSAVFAAVILLALFATAALSDKSSGGGTSRLSALIGRISDIARSDSHRPALAWISIHENSPSRR